MMLLPASVSEPTADLDDDALLAQCEVESLRASGPGGQHRNKTETAIRLHHTPTGIVAGASERRSRMQNLGVALDRLRALLKAHFAPPPPPRRKTRPSRASRVRRRVAKANRGQVKQTRRPPGGED